MLAKIWKKVLLAICIIACIFNIMSKLVNRHSLKENLESANDGITVFSIFQKDEVVETESKPIIEGVINTEETSNQEQTNTSVILTYQTNENVQEDENIDDTENLIEEDIVEDTVTEEKDKKDGTFKFSDFIIYF